MTAKRRTSDRKRSRPVEKRSKVTFFKKNKLLTSLLLIIIAIIVIAAGYFYFENTATTDTEDESNPIAVFDTNMGTFRVVLFRDKAPITVNNFVDLANDKFYDGTKFHRVSPNFMIQGGDPNSKDDDPTNDGQGGPGYTIEDEFHPELKNERGMLSMANSGPNTGGSQFFILVEDASWLDNAHAVFGQVIEGMDVVDAIANVAHGGEFEPNPGGGIPLEDVVVNSVLIVKSVTIES
jgi:peptidyl-prolyl cis-trans isomerase A (cyclophilin A)